MTQQILMILPSTEDEAPRLVGPFLTEATAVAWADDKGIEPVRRVIRPLESPTSIYGYGRHALIPSPTPRRVVAEAVADWEEKKEQARRAGPRGGISSIMEDIYGPPPPLPDMPTRRLAEDSGVLWQREPDGAWKPVAETTNPTLRIDAEREEPPPGAPPLTGGIRHWITGEAMESAPREVPDKAEMVATWSGRVARFNHATTDGRVLELRGALASDWPPHFARVPVGVWVMVPNVGALPVGLCERVRVEDGWLWAEGRVSISHLGQAAPNLLKYSMPDPLDDTYGMIPAAIDVTKGVHSVEGGAPTISGPWELDRVVFGSVPAWLGCAVRLGTVEAVLRG